MEMEINLEKKHFALITLICIILTAGMAIANQNVISLADPALVNIPNPGHSSVDVVVNLDGGGPVMPCAGDMSLQNAIDNGCIGGGMQTWSVQFSNEIPAPIVWADVPGMTINANTNGGKLLILFNTVINSEDARSVWIRLTVDGATRVTTQTRQDNTGQTYDRDSASLHWIEQGLAAGPHVFKIQWRSQSASNRMNPQNQTDRLFSVIELE